VSARGKERDAGRRARRRRRRKGKKARKNPARTFGSPLDSRQRKKGQRPPALRRKEGSPFTWGGKKKEAKAGASTTRRATKIGHNACRGERGGKQIMPSCPGGADWNRRLGRGFPLPLEKSEESSSSFYSRKGSKLGVGCLHLIVGEREGS